MPILPNADRKIIGSDLRDLEFAWPVGLPLCRSLGAGLWEVRRDLSGRKIARILFCTAHGRAVLLHGSVKKTQKTPPGDLALARKRPAGSAPLTAQPCLPVSATALKCGITLIFKEFSAKVGPLTIFG